MGAARNQRMEGTMTHKNAGRESQGWCAPCRTLWSWFGLPYCCDADCPKCGKPLAKKPHPKSMGRHDIVNARPRERCKPPIKSDPPPSDERKSA